MTPCNRTDIWGMDGPLDAHVGMIRTRAMLEAGYPLAPHAAEMLLKALDDADAIRRLLAEKTQRAA